MGEISVKMNLVWCDMKKAIAVTEKANSKLIFQHALIRQTKCINMKDNNNIKRLI